MIKAGFFQFSPLFGEVQKNLNRIIKTISNASADLIVLPELHFQGIISKTVKNLVLLLKSRKILILFHLLLSFAVRKTCL